MSLKTKILDILDQREIKYWISNSPLVSKTWLNLIIDIDHAHFCRILSSNLIAYEPNISIIKDDKYHLLHTEERLRCCLLGEKTKKYFFRKLLKSIKEENASDFIEECESSGILELFIPELSKCRKTGGGSKHNEDVLTHLISTLTNVSGEVLVLKLASLLHDVGKPKSATTKDGDIHFHGHEVYGANIAENICMNIGLSRKDTKEVKKIIRLHMFRSQELLTNRATLKRFLYKTGNYQSFNSLIKLRIADRKANKANEDKKAYTHELKELVKLVNKINETKLIVFPDDLNISSEEIKNITGRENNTSLIKEMMFQCGIYLMQNSRKELVHYAKQKISRSKDNL